MALRESTDPSLALFGVALFYPFPLEPVISENGETRWNGRIIEISPAEEGASPWLWSPIRYRVSRSGLARWG